MADITAAQVKAFRDRVGLPMMDCKSALTEAGGDEEMAIEILRKKGKKLSDSRSGRETGFGRFGLYFGLDRPAGAMVELFCESAPVASNPDFVQLANDLAQQLATGPGAKTAEELLAQASPSQKGKTLAEQKDELFNRIREVFNVGRMERLEGATAGYGHNSTNVAGVLLGAEGSNADAAKDICMHVAAMRPAGLSKEDIPAEMVAKEREFLREAALKEGKPENVVDKMVEGRLRTFFAERVLTEQPFVKDDKQTVGNFATTSGLKLRKFIHWELGKSH